MIVPAKTALFKFILRRCLEKNDRIADKIAAECRMCRKTNVGPINRRGLD